MYFTVSFGSSQAERHGMGVHDGASGGNGGSVGAFTFRGSHLASRCNLRRSSCSEWNHCLLPPWDAKYSTSWYPPRCWGEVRLEMVSNVLKYFLSRKVFHTKILIYFDFRGFRKLKNSFSKKKEEAMTDQNNMPLKESVWGLIYNTNNLWSKCSNRVRSYLCTDSRFCK